jgi:hypothetical protein
MKANESPNPVDVCLARPPAVARFAEPLTNDLHEAETPSWIGWRIEVRAGNQRASHAPS